jgi:hypothetical protein
MYWFPCCVVIVQERHILHDNNIPNRLPITKVKFDPVQVMKAYGEMEAHSHSFLIFGVQGVMIKIYSLLYPNINLTFLWCTLLPQMRLWQLSYWWNNSFSACSLITIPAEMYWHQLYSTRFLKPHYTNIK